MKVTLTKVTRYTTDKNGAPLMGKNGKPYTRVNIQTQEHGEKWLSGFGNPINQNWAEGQAVEVEVKQNGEYLNFDTLKASDVKMQNMQDALKSRFQKIDARFLAIEKHIGMRGDPDAIDAAMGEQLAGAKEMQAEMAPQDEPPVEAYEKDAGEINADDIPF